jgi:hypothetical protein
VPARSPPDSYCRHVRFSNVQRFGRSFFGLYTKRRCRGNGRVTSRPQTQTATSVAVCIGAYALPDGYRALRRRAKNSPIKPPPSNPMVAGSGTATVTPSKFKKPGSSRNENASVWVTAVVVPPKV